jgi:signal transduction histidine kinase
MCVAEHLAELRRQTARFDALAAASQAFARAQPDQTAVLNSVVRRVADAFGDYCHLSLVDENGETLSLVAAHHPNPDVVELGHRLAALAPQRVGLGLTGRVAASREPIIMAEVDQERLRAQLRPEHRAWGERFPIHGVLIVPLLSADHLLGTLGLSRTEPDRPYTDDDLAFLQDLADRAALAISNARLYAAERRAREEAERLAALTRQLTGSLSLEAVLEQVADAAAQLLRAPVAGVFLLDAAGAAFELAAGHGLDAPRGSRTVHLMREHSVAGRAVASGHPIVVDDVQTESVVALLRELEGGLVGSLVVAPIMAATGPLGVVEAYAPMPRAFGAHDAQLLSAFAAAAAVALSNARLYQEARDQVTTQATLNAALREVAEERDRALGAAQEAIRSRDDFLAAASHDLKNPLTTIKGTAQALRRQVERGPSDPERLTAALRAIDGAATKLTAQIDGLLETARRQTGQPLDLDRQPTDLVALVREAAAEYQQTSESHRIRVETTAPEVIGLWDPTRLERVIGNLLANALKYSPAGGEVVATVAADEDGRTVLRVRDQGIGIPAADLPRIFDRFARGGNVVGRIAGTGLGLTAVRQIVEQHAGTITAESEEGAGSVFTVRLPPGAPADDERRSCPEPRSH